MPSSTPPRRRPGDSPRSDSASVSLPPVPPGPDMKRLKAAVEHLAVDTRWFVDAFSELLESMRPHEPAEEDSAEDAFLVESGSFTAEELAETKRSLARGSLHIRMAASWLSPLLATLSLRDTAGFLGRGEDAVRAAVTDGFLYAYEVTGQLRFPDWQFDVSKPGKVIPHLQELIEVMTSRWGDSHIAGFMHTPQRGLIGEGRQTPIAWLRDGGGFQDVKELIESSDWR